MAKFNPFFFNFVQTTTENAWKKRDKKTPESKISSHFQQSEQ